MRQLALGISPPPDPSFDNFVIGASGELVARLRELADGRLAESIFYLWGETGSGRSHLLAAAARAATRPLVVADDVERFDEAQQRALFIRINEARDSGGAILAAGNAPPAQLPLREDLRSRLAWGLVYHLQPLTDVERVHYLQSEAARRGMRLGDEVARYLLNHVRRDLPSLGAILDRVDRLSLEQQRAVTLPLVRAALKAAAE
ncbi:MAG: DnaA regulatory inactivator Hda [Betaproteobacteria bacterium]|nr:MAG: DnaA regulatory inactivator Hda [Betaproteobacteria bacterium]